MTIKNLLILAFLCFTATMVNAQKVATYSTGTPGQEDYESFAFWIKDDARSFISYNYGADRKEAKITYAGKDNFKGVDCFKIQFSNKLVLYVMTNGTQLQIADKSGNYLKTFKWEYEGPVNGVGAFCNVCAASAEEAIKIIKEYY